MSLNRYVTLLLAVGMGVASAAQSAPQCSENGGREACAITVKELPPDPRYAPVPRYRAADQPKVAIALSGGGAKGLAHIGVLDELEARGVQIDAVTGTSMGAVIGSLYAAGYTPEQIQSVFTGRDWNPIMGTLDINHGALSEKEEIRERAGQLSFRYENGRRVRRRAFFKGSEMEEALGRLLFHAQVASGGDFDKLLIPLRVVAADADKAVAFAPSTGQLPRLVRASISFPGVYEPVDYEGRTLVDGLVVSNIPTQEAAEFSPDLIFASDVTLPFSSTLKVSGSLALLGRVVDVMLSEQQSRSKSLADVVFTPQVKGLAPVDLHAEVDKKIEVGRESVDAMARELADRLQRKSLSPRLAVERVVVNGAPAGGLEAELRGNPSALQIALALARLRNRGPVSDARADYAPAGKTLTLTLVPAGELRGLSLRVDGESVRWPAPGGPFSWALARRVIGDIRTRYTDAGFAAFNVNVCRWDGATGQLALEATTGTLSAAQYEIAGAASRAVTEKRLDLHPGATLNADEVMENLGELKGRGVLEQWSVEPSAAAPGAAPAASLIDLKISGEAAHGLELRGGGSYRDELKGQGFAQVKWINPAGRGDRLDVTLVKGIDSDRVEAGYHQEYLWGARHPVGFDFRGVAFADNFPLIEQGIHVTENRPFRGWRGTVGAFYRTPATGYLGLSVGAESIGTPRFDGIPREHHTRRFAALSFDYDRRDRVDVPTTGTYLRASVDSSIGGIDYRREQVELGHSMLLLENRQGALSGRIALGASQGKIPFYAWFNPGGWRENYGYMSYGLAAPDYALLAATYRQALLDLGPLQLYGEIGATGARTAYSFHALTNSRDHFGGGASLIAVNNLLGPITLGYQFNSEKGKGPFLLIGYAFGRN